MQAKMPIDKHGERGEGTKDTHGLWRKRHNNGLSPFDALASFNPAASRPQCPARHTPWDQRSRRMRSMRRSGSAAPQSN